MSDKATWEAETQAHVIHLISLGQPGPPDLCQLWNRRQMGLRADHQATARRGGTAGKRGKKGRQCTGQLFDCGWSRVQRIRQRHMNYGTTVKGKAAGNAVGTCLRAASCAVPLRPPLIQMVSSTSCPLPGSNTPCTFIHSFAALLNHLCP